MSYSVGQVARITGVTVRTLHHYDGIGLLTPGGRSHAGHRRYDDADLDRLQQILFYRELGFPLEEVAVLLDDPRADPRAHLRRQHGLLTGRIERLRRMAAAVETAMEAHRMGIRLTPEEKFEVFGDFDPDAHAREAEERWGTTDAYRQSRRRTTAWTKDDWKDATVRFDAIHRRMADLLVAGTAADSGARRTSPRSTAGSSPTGTTPATPPCTPRSARCTWPMNGSPRRTRRSSRVSRSICGTRCGRTRNAGAAGRRCGAVRWAGGRLRWTGPVGQDG